MFAVIHPHYRWTFDPSQLIIVALYSYFYCGASSTRARRRAAAARERHSWRRSPAPSW